MSSPSRLIVHGDAFAWLDANPATEGCSVVTSLPDLSEIPGTTLESWRSWFVHAAQRVLAWTPPSGVTIFYQSDIRQDDVWVDKGYLVQKAAEAVGAHLVWHKIVCRQPPGTVSLGRPSYSHMVCFARVPRARARRPGPDILPDAGAMAWSKAIGLDACRVACRYLVDETDTKTVVDPFCGRGTILAVANEFGMDAIGVELSAKRCKAARNA
jgi:hypothetical protein